MGKLADLGLDIDRIQPLLRVIGREISDRTHSIQELEERLAAFSKTPRIHANEISAAESDLSLQRRELRRIQSELAHLGVAFDAQMPWVAPRLIAAAASAKDPTSDTSFHRAGDSRRH